MRRAGVDERLHVRERIEEDVRRAILTTTETGSDMTSSILASAAGFSRREKRAGLSPTNKPSSGYWWMYSLRAQAT
jgi:hypothetical protein